jgi:hypothetical protein
MKSHQADKILRRLEADAVVLGDISAFEPPKYIGLDPEGNPVRLPRWRISSKWLEFECGCRAQRYARLEAPAKPTDPLIFVGLPEQAIYDDVCHHHSPAMNKRLKLAGYVDFKQWYGSRRRVLLGL